MAIAKRKQKDTYQIQIIIGYKIENGKKKAIKYSEMFYGKKKDAEIQEAKLKEQYKKGGFVYNAKTTFNELIDKWYEEVALPTLEIKTIESYDVLLIDIRKELGNYILSELSMLVLQHFYNKLRADEKRHLSENTILHYYVLIGRILNMGVKWQWVDRNVNELIDRPKPIKAPATYYEEKEIQKVMECLKYEPLKYQVVILLALDSGCRRGELTGLTWEDVNFSNNSIFIDKTTQTTKQGVIEKEMPKNNSSIRPVILMEQTMEVLKRYKEEQEQLKEMLGNEWKGSNKVLIDNYGGRMHPDTPSKIWAKFRKKYDLPHMKFHGLRHTSATIQIALGVHTKVISQRLGHSSTTVTDTIYSHVFTRLQQDVSKEMSNYLYNK